MKKNILIGLGVATLISLTSMTGFANEEAIKTNDGLLEIELPEGNWYEIVSEENTEMFSDGDCAILVNLYKNGETLPAIQSADKNHELIYTAAASTQDYILHVVGYAHERSDFSGICKAINSIKVDDTKIAESMLNHTVAVETYGIADMNYTAWVSTDGLNVRSTSEDGEIITVLGYGDKVTVTGSILKNSVEIGWARIRTADGTEGYVSEQFLSTTVTADEAPEAEEEAQKTSTIIKVYDVNANEYYLTVYSDGTTRAEDGRIFWQDRNGYYVDGSDLILYLERPNGGNHRNGNTMTFYDSTGNAVTAYQYTNGEYYDDYFNVYRWQGGNHDTWVVNNGEWLVTTYNPLDEDTDYEIDPFDPFTSFEVVDDSGCVFTISYHAGDGVWYDNDGLTFYRYNTYGAYMDEFGVLYHML